MNRVFVASASALFLIACTKPDRTTGSAAPVEQVKLELGKNV